MVGLWRLVVGMSKIDDAINFLKSKKVTIGIHGDKGEQKKVIRSIPAYKNLKKVRADLESWGVEIQGRLTRHRIDNNLTVAQVASYNEFGNQKVKNRPPERPFLRRVFKEKKREILQVASVALKKDPANFFELIGQYVLKQVQLGIQQEVFKPNSEYTKRFKGSSKPLVDTGQLRNALAVKVSDAP